MYNRKTNSVGGGGTSIPLTTAGVTDRSPVLYTGVYSPIYRFNGVFFNLDYLAGMGSGWVWIMNIPPYFILTST